VSASFRQRSWTGDDATVIALRWRTVR